MAFHGMLVVRDEGDFIAQSLSHLLTWCDAVYVLDTGSTDGTWEHVLAAAGADRRVVPLRREAVYFTDEIRAMMFQELRGRFRRGDWVARLDADEVHAVPPPVFVRERLTRAEGLVYCQMYEFVLTASEAAAWEAGRETVADRARPIRERRRWYFVDPYPEIRLFRYRRTMRWHPSRYEPFSTGLLARARLPIMHFRCRDPEQVRRRCEIRAAMAARGLPYEHWRVEDWRRWVIPDDEPRLRRAEPEEALPEVRDESHLARPRRRLLQRVYYGSGAVVLRDLVRARFPAGFAPERMPEGAGAGPP